MSLNEFAGDFYDFTFAEPQTISGITVKSTGDTQSVSVIIHQDGNQEPVSKVRFLFGTPIRYCYR